MKKTGFCALALVFASLMPLAPGARAAELLVNGTFVTTGTIPANSYSSDVSRIGGGGFYNLNGATGTAGWFTTASDARFEVWTAGYQGTASGIGNVLELAANFRGATIYQPVTSTVGGGVLGNVSFGYAARDIGTDAFTVSVTDTTAGTLVFSQALNPTNALASPITFTQAFTIVPGHAYQLNFLDQSTNGTNPLSAHINSVSFTQVPEPSSLAAMLIAVAGMCVFARRRACK